MVSKLSLCDLGSSASSVVDTLEDEILAMSCDSSAVEAVWMEAGNHRNIRVVIANRFAKDSPPMILVHGTMSCSVATWGASLKHIAERHRGPIYAIDLPGFGRSAFPDAISEMDAGESTELYCDFLHQFHSAHFNVPVLLVGHSYGAFIALEYAYRWPATIESVILACPVGFFPSLGDFGSWWAVIFSLGFPARQLRFLGSFRLKLFSMLFEMMNLDPLAMRKACHEVRYIGVKPCVNDISCRYIHIGPLSTSWRHPNIHKLLGLQTKVSMIFGAEDSIIPPHIGKAATSLMDSNVPCLILPNAWHRPMVEFPENFADCLAQAIYGAVKPGLAASSTAEKLQSVPWHKWRSPFSPSLARSMIESELYRLLQDVHENNHVSPPIVIDALIP
jgi:pimeloyl-ACP methyl ester carboxylesterase